jgi:glyoxylase-like metal-dependent hydrolase (beta-lactamase superfamily II)
VHLDHAGGAGALMRALPNATLVVHPRGAPHMIDPAKLTAGAKAVYGEAEFENSYGTLVPVPASRVMAIDDGRVDLAGRPLLCADTPGHARHHLAVWDARSRSWFAGDIFGLSYREFDTARGAFAIPTTSPVQFDPVAMRASVRRMLAEAPEAVYVTHYGRVTDVQRLGADLIALVDAMTDTARRLDGVADRHARLVEMLTRIYVERAQRHGVADAQRLVPALLAMDIELNVQGLEVWLERERQAVPERAGGAIGR